jgi:hypothetical protein
MFFRLLVYRKAKYILQNATPKSKQSPIQQGINQLFQKIKNKHTNKHSLKMMLVLAEELRKYSLYSDFFVRTTNLVNF